MNVIFLNNSFSAFKFSVGLPVSEAILQICPKFEINEPQFFGLFCPQRGEYLSGNKI
jgi:hypothetical protein